MAESTLERQERIKYLVGLYCQYHHFNDEIKEIIITLMLMIVNVYGYDTRIIIQPDTKMFTSWLIDPLPNGYGYYVENVIFNKLFFNIQDIKLVTQEDQIINKKSDYNYKTKTVYIDTIAYLNLVKDNMVGNSFKVMQDIKWRIYFAPLLGALQTNFNNGPLNENNRANKQYLDFFTFLEEDSFQKGRAKYYRDFNFKRPKTYLGKDYTYEKKIDGVTFSDHYLDWLKEGELNFILNPQIQAYCDLNDLVTMGIYNELDSMPHSSNYGVMLMAALGPTRVFKRLYCNDNHPTNDFNSYISRQEHKKSFKSLVDRIKTVLSRVDIYQGTNSYKIKKMIEIELELMSALIKVYEIRLSYDREYQDKNSEEIRARIVLETTLMHNFHLRNRLSNKPYIIDFKIYKKIHQNLAKIDEIKERYISYKAR